MGFVLTNQAHIYGMSTVLTTTHQAHIYGMNTVLTTTHQAHIYGMSTVLTTTHQAHIYGMSTVLTTTHQAHIYGMSTVLTTTHQAHIYGMSTVLTTTHQARMWHGHGHCLHNTSCTHVAWAWALSSQHLMHTCGMAIVSTNQAHMAWTLTHRHRILRVPFLFFVVLTTFLYYEWHAREWLILDNNTREFLKRFQRLKVLYNLIQEKYGAHKYPHGTYRSVVWKQTENITHALTGPCAHAHNASKEYMHTQCQ